MKLFDWLFRRKPKGPSPLAEAISKAEEGDEILIYGDDDVRIKKGPGPDIIGRQGGQARNRVHIYRQPYGYPIRLCDWVFVDKGSIEVKGECLGEAGPAEAITLTVALDWRENAGDRLCQTCQAIAQGKRKPPCFAHWKGRGTGAPCGP